MVTDAEILRARILIVDDRESDLFFYEQMLAGAGYSNVTTTPDSREVADLHRAAPFDLILLDLRMPAMDGFEVMARLREIEAGVLPVLALSGDGEAEERALAAGARDFLRKPASVPRLRARIRNMLETQLLLKESNARSQAFAGMLEERTASLAESENLFRLVAANIPQALWIRGAGDRVFSYVNPAWAKVTGRPLLPGEPIERALEAVHPEDLAAVRADIEAHPLGGIDREVRLLDGEARVRWGHVRTFPITDARGRTDWIAGILEDITYRRHMEDALRDSESRFRALVDQSIIGIFVIEGDRLTYANPKLCEILGYGREELDALQFTQVIVVDDHAVVEETLRRRREGETGPIRMVCRARRKDGRVIHLRIESRIIDLLGRQAALGVVQDVTAHVTSAKALREAEERYRLLCETAMDAIIILGDDMKIEFANPAVKEVFGYEPHELQGQDIAILQPERLRAGHRAGMNRYLRSGVKTLNWHSTETVALDRHGAEFPVEIAFSDLRIGDKQVFAAFMRDISARTRATAQAEEATRRQRMLSKRVHTIQEEERRALSLELHDEMGQSMVALRIGLHRLGAHVADDARELLDECASVVDDIHERLRELASRLHPPQLELGLEDALRSLVSRLQRATGVRIECAFSGLEGARIPGIVTTTSYRICQEALSNAVRHAGAALVRVSADFNGRILAVRVFDDGAGFDEAAGREAAMRAGCLGLLGMEERARIAGGWFELESRPGAGTRVGVIFPINEATAERAD